MFLFWYKLDHQYYYFFMPSKVLIFFYIMQPKECTPSHGVEIGLNNKTLTKEGIALAHGSISVQCVTYKTEISNYDLECGHTQNCRPLLLRQNTTVPTFVFVRLLFR